jgi:ABC-type lipoprotein export system ATPase subunit/ABC-type antimicrobial peptide transport system permease subunit
MKEMIRLDQVSKIYSNNGSSSIGIQNVSASFSLGEFVAITGESGSGKSTFLNVVSLLDSYEEGELFIDGKSTVEFNKEDFAKYQANYVSFVFQEYNIIDSFSCLDNVMLPLLAKGVSLKEAKAKAYTALDEVGLKKNAHQRAAKLSGGQKQRVVIARALVSDTPVLACDEPTGNLDSKTGKDIIALFKRIAKNKLVFFVTHDYDSIKDVATRHIVIKDGHILSDEKLRDAPVTYEKPIPKKEKTNFWHRIFLGVKDVVCTPKKSLLSFIIALLVSLGGLGIVFGSYSMLTSYSSSVTTTLRNYSYSLVSSNRLIAYDKGKSDTSLAKYSFSNDCYIDYGSTISNIDYFRYLDNDLSSSEEVYSSSLSNGGIFYSGYSKVLGREPESEDEAAILFPQSYSDTYIKKVSQTYFIDHHLTINPFAPKSLDVALDSTYKIVGCYKSNWLSRPSEEAIAFSKKGFSSFAQKFDSFITSSTLTIDNISFISGNSLINPATVYNNLTFSMDNIATSNSTGIYSLAGISLHNIYVAKELINEDLVVNYKGTSFTIPSSKLTAFPDTFQSGSNLAISYPALYPFMKSEAPVISAFFTSEDATVVAVNELRNQHFDAKIASTPDTIYTNSNYFIIFLIILFVAIFALLGLLLAFIGALIFRIIYASKRKDYAVYTTLSFSLYDVKWINFTEILFYFLGGSLVSFFLFLILANTVSNPDFLRVISPLLQMYESPLAIILYFVSIILYALLISWWTMKKLIKKTRAANLRKDDSLI